MGTSSKIEIYMDDTYMVDPFVYFHPSQLPFIATFPSYNYKIKFKPVMMAVLTHVILGLLYA